jgi:hypothetical protein
MDIHESPVTACLYVADCPQELIQAYYSVGCKNKNKTGYSEKVSTFHCLLARMILLLAELIVMRAVGLIHASPITTVSKCCWNNANWQYSALVRQSLTKQIKKSLQHFSYNFFSSLGYVETRTIHLSISYLHQILSKRERSSDS